MIFKRHALNNKFTIIFKTKVYLLYSMGYIKDNSQIEYYSFQFTFLYLSEKVLLTKSTIAFRT